MKTIKTLAQTYLTDSTISFIRASKTEDSFIMFYDETTQKTVKVKLSDILFIS